MIQLLKKLFFSILYGGIKSHTPEALKRKIIISNAISMAVSTIVFFLSFVFAYLGLVENILFLAFGFITAVCCLVFNHIEKYNIARICISNIPPIVTILMSVVTKLHGSTNSLVFVFAPRILLLSFAFLPVILYSYEDLKKMLLSLSLPFLLLVFFEEIHLFFGIDVYSMPLGTTTFIFKIAFTMNYIILGIIIFSQQRLGNLYEQKIEALLQTTQEQNKHITDSIQYARRIQRSILHSEKEVIKAFQEAFILLLPKDIVSGDFYWFHQSEDHQHIIIAAADCTGHGVPGAFMTVMGNDLLTEIVYAHTTWQPNQVLCLLDEKVRAVLRKQTAEEQRQDGMDIALAYIDKKQHKLYFSGAKNPLFQIRNGELLIYKGSKYPIGGDIEVSNKYEMYEIDYEENDIFYLFSDGYQDQFGGKENKKYMSKRFKEKLSGIYTNPLEIQKEILWQEHLAWKAQETQTDDILVVGFRI